MNPKDLAPFLDLANHHANATFADIENICDKVKKYGFNAVFVNQCFVPFAKKIMGPEGKVGTVVSFPLGQDSPEIKIAAAKAAAINGADELDISLNVGLIKEGQWDESLAEMQNIVREVKAVDQKKIVKFILETGYLTDDEIKKTSVLILQSGADFVKTNSGMGPRGVIVKDVELIKEATEGKIKIKVAGGVDTFAEAMALINAGASRIGTSRAVEIITS
ncbi:deoxyribose-phosphate aldolase [Candidatus Collierbacteria bacterium]|nr:deoxyribose-phosphate aldolase [Candidatus Collierbacteria bacterium]